VVIKDRCECGSNASDPNPDCERCRLAHTVRAAAACREAQKAYFAGRTGQLLRDAQAAERYLDICLRRLNTIQPTLFDVEDYGK
jgi:hypothetical protein